MKITEDLAVVIDTSGSMSESSKLYSARGLVIKIGQHTSLGYSTIQPVLYSWSNELKTVPWSPEEDYPEVLMVGEGSTNASDLVSHFQNSSENILVITDGGLTNQDLSAFTEWEKTRERDSIKILQLSGDSEQSKFWSSTHHADDLIAILHSWYPDQTL